MTQTERSFDAEPATDTSLAERAYRIVRDRIISLELRPGAVIQEEELSRDIGVGKTPLRDALKRLSRERLVVVLPRRGTLVSEINISDLAQISETRAVIEGFAASLAAERATDEQREHAERLSAQLSRLARNTPPTELVRLDREIHHLIYAAAHNPYLEDILIEQYNLSLRLWFLVLSRVSRVDDMVREHRELLNAIRRRRPPQAQAIAEQHVREFERAIRAAV